MPVVDPLFWLGLSLLLVATSLMSVLLVAIPALRELARAARSAEKLFDTLNRELPPTLEAIRLTGLELTDLTDDVSEGVQHAGRVIQQVDQSVRVASDQAKQLQVGGQSFLAGVRAAWKTWSRPTRPTPTPLRNKPTSRHQEPRLRKPKRTAQATAIPSERSSQLSLERPTLEPPQSLRPNSSEPRATQPSSRRPLFEQSLEPKSEQQATSGPLPPAASQPISDDASVPLHPTQETQND